MKQLRLLVLILLSIYSYVAFAQEKEPFTLYHKVSVAISHANISEGRDGAGNNIGWKALPSWTLDYDLGFAQNWMIGLHSDIIIETFEVENNLGDNSQVLKRTRPIALAAMGTYKATEHLGIELGFGGEFAKEENFALARIGLEYGWELPNNFEVGGTLNYDFKFNAYDTYVIGFSISKLLR